MKNFKKKSSIIFLLLNMFVFPGVGTLLANKQDIGISQITTALISIPLMLVGFGFITFIAAWIWSIYSGFMIIKES